MNGYMLQGDSFSISPYFNESSRQHGLEIFWLEMNIPASQQLLVLYSREQIEKRVAELGEAITRDYAGETVIMIGVLKGSAFFLSDLARSVHIDCTFDFVAVSSYKKGRTTSGAVKLTKDLDEPIEGKHVIIVEDILDTGITLGYLRKIFLQHHPKSLKIATCLDKPARRIEPIEA